MGIGLADARLLVEKFKNQKRAEELASMVAAVRNGKERFHTKKKKVEKLKIEYSWHHYDEAKKKYCVVRISCGGGIRTGEFHRDENLNVILKDMKGSYFPGGRNKKGKISGMNCNLCGGDKAEIDDLDMSLGSYFDLKGLKSRKLYLQTKKKGLLERLEFHYDSADDSLKDFDVDFDNLVKSTPEADKEQQRLERLNLIKSQDEAYNESLAADRKKDEEQIVAEEKRVKEEKESIEKEKAQILTDDAVLVVVNHVHLGRKEETFLF